MIIIVDTMGADNSPDAIVNGCLDAIAEKDGFDINLVGDSDKINQIIDSRGIKSSRIIITHSDEVITCEDSPSKAIRNKKNSSMVIGFNLLKEKKGDIFISAGNSGALMAGALFILGRLKGIDRPALPALIPTLEGKALIIDAGLNAVCKPINFLQFGIMGSIYMKETLNIECPTVGLVNVGSEQGKGNDLIKQAYDMLSKTKVNFKGNIEGNDILVGKVHVAVCDGFVGNVTLKFLEGVSSFLKTSLKDVFTSNISTKISYLLVKSKLNEFMKNLSKEENGGAPILGVNGLVIKSHGSSNAKTIKNVIIKRAYVLAKSSVLEQIREEFKNVEVEDIANG